MIELILPVKSSVENSAQFPVKYTAGQLYIVNGSVSRHGVQGTVSGQVGATWRHCKVFFITSKCLSSWLYRMISLIGSPEFPKQVKPKKYSSIDII